MRQARGFTLLEVLVAVAILGLGLTMILSSQVGLFSSASRGQHLTLASNLARCKMAEVEIDLLKKGYPVIDQNDEGRCCGDEDDDTYRCATKVERVTLPEPGSLPGSDGGGMDQLGPFAALAQLEAAQGAPGAPGAGPAPGPNSLQDIAQSIGSSASASGMGPLVMSLVYPDLKPLLEASIRRVTVTVLWKEGVKERELAVTQYVTDPQQGGLDQMASDAGLPLDTERR